MQQALKNIFVLLTTMNSKLDTSDERTEGIADLKTQVQEMELRVNNLEDRNFQLLKRVEALEIANTSKSNYRDGVQPGISSGTGNQDDKISWKDGKYLPGIGTYNNYRNVHDSDGDEEDDYYDEYTGGGIRDVADYDSDTGNYQY